MAQLDRHRGQRYACLRPDKPFVRFRKGLRPKARHDEIQSYLASLTFEGNKTPVDFINRKFQPIKNKANGNCLFEALSFLLYRKDPTLNAFLRQQVCEFYTAFDPLRPYVLDSLSYNIAFSMTFDEDEEVEDDQDDQDVIVIEDEEDEKLPHSKNICKDMVYASATDIMVLAKLFRLNIILFKVVYSPEGQYYNTALIENTKSRKLVHIRHVGGNHYEAMMPTAECRLTMEEYAQMTKGSNGSKKAKKAKKAKKGSKAGVIPKLRVKLGQNPSDRQRAEARNGRVFNPLTGKWVSAAGRTWKKIKTLGLD
jgi:hypothetical protein